MTVARGGDYDAPGDPAMPTTHPDVDAFIANAQPFARPILERIRKAFHAGCPDCVEALKWGYPAFLRKGLLGGMAAFKAHVAFGFWHSVDMADPENLFRGDCKSSFMRIRVRDAKELPSHRVLVAYVKEAARVDEERAQAPPKRKPAKKKASAVAAPTWFLDAIAASPAAQATWDGFAYTYRKEYVDWVVGAKRQATRDARLAQAIAWMAEGKKRNWKYM